MADRAVGAPRAAIAPPAGCRVELYGPARLVAGVKEIVVRVEGTASIQQLVGALAHACPALVGPVLDRDRAALTDGYVFNLNGRQFLARPDDAIIRPGDRVLLLANAAGG